MSTVKAAGDSEKRRHPRFDIQDLDGSLLLAMDVRVQNLSVSGMAVETSARLTVGRSYRFKLRHRERVLVIMGTVAWSFLHRTHRNCAGEVEPVYRAGVRFDGMLTDNAHALLEILEEKAVLRLDKRIFGRFPVPQVDDVEVDSESRFSVRRISLSGMLIESPTPPKIGQTLRAELDLGAGPVPLSFRVVNLENGECDDAPARVGVEFVDLEPNQIRAIESFVALHLDDVTTN